MAKLIPQALLTLLLAATFSCISVAPRTGSQTVSTAESTAEARVASTTETTLRSGPMLGYVTMREVAVWVQTAESAEVRLRYWPTDAPTQVMHSAFAKTQPTEAYCATLIADSLQEGTQYRYEVLLDGSAIASSEPFEFETQPLWAYRTDPPEITFALGSCYYANEEAYDRPGRPYGGEYKIFESIDALRPDLMLWLGDNIYLRPGDFDARSGILHRNSDARAVAELQPLLRHMPNYAIWDDHDFGPNDSDRGYIHKDWTRDAFELFWANPPTAIAALEGTNATQFRFGDAEFFLLDNRSKRAPNECTTCEPMDYFGTDQLNWLMDALVSSDAAFKFVATGGQILNDAPVFENYVHHHSAERQVLLDRIAAEGIENVIFLTGDRHHTELSRMTLDSTVLYDFTVSPLTSGASTRSENEPNSHRVDGTWVGVRNFGTITLAGPRLERTATLKIYDAEGGVLWEQLLNF